MKRTHVLTAIFFSAALTGCAHGPAAVTAAAPGRDTHEMMNSLLWMQTSAEYRADALGKYAQARSSLDAALADRTWTAALEQTGDYAALPPAVIMDLDETVLNNLRFDGEVLKRRIRYQPQLWAQWIAMADSSAVPGALDFIRYAQSKGVKVIFITNRPVAEEASTRANLAKLKITLPSGEDTVLTYRERGETRSDKASRRALVAKDHRVLLLVGDDLGDFVSAKKTLAEREAMVDANAARWGKSWILIANPVHGSWESALTQYENGKSDAEVLKAHADQVKGF